MFTPGPIEYDAACAGLAIVPQRRYQYNHANGMANLTTGTSTVSGSNIGSSSGLGDSNSSGGDTL